VKERLKWSVSRGLAWATLTSGGASTAARDKHRAMMVKMASVLLFMSPPLFGFALAEIDAINQNALALPY
jgi:hypothetical protein